MSTLPSWDAFPVRPETPSSGEEALRYAVKHLSRRFPGEAPFTNDEVSLLLRESGCGVQVGRAFFQVLFDYLRRQGAEPYEWLPRTPRAEALALLSRATW